MVGGRDGQGVQVVSGGFPPFFLLLCQFFTVASYILTDKHEGLSVKKSLLLGLFLFEKLPEMVHFDEWVGEISQL